MKADRQAETETCERTEGAATAVKKIYGENCFTNLVNLGPKTTSTYFGVKADPPALPGRDGVLVDNGAKAPKSCLPPLEMRPPRVAGGFLPTGEASITTRTTYNQPPLRLYSTEETNSKTTNLMTPVLSFSYDSSFFWKNNMSTALSCRRVIETKSGQNGMIQPGGSKGRLRACPFMGTWHALLCGEVIRFGAAEGDLQCFFVAGRRSAEYHSSERGTSNSTAFFPQRLIKKGHAAEGGRGYRS